MSAPAEIIERIKKLLRLSKSSNPHEAQLALERAMALAAEYRVAVDQLNADAPAPNITHQETEAFARISYDRKFASLIVKRFFRVRPIICGAIRVTDGWPSAGQKISFVGTASDIEIALYVYHFIVGHFSYCWRKHRGRCRSRYSFVEGMFQGIWSRLRDTEQPASARPSTGLEIEPSIEGYLQRHFGKLSSLPMQSSTANAARYAGYIQGINTEIRPAVKQGWSQLALG